MTKAAMNELCLKIVEFVEENPYCTRLDVDSAVSKGKTTQHAWDSVKHLFEYKISNGRYPVTYKRNKITYSREVLPYVNKKDRKPSLAILALAREMKTIINDNPGITGADIRESLNLTNTRFKRASMLLNVDRKRTFGRGTGYWPSGTAPDTVRAVRLPKAVKTTVNTNIPIYDGIVLTQWRGGNPFAQMAAS